MHIGSTTFGPCASREANRSPRKQTPRFVRLQTLLFARPYVRITAGYMTPRQDPCQESSSVRPSRTAVIRRTPSPLPSYGHFIKSQSIRRRGCSPGKANVKPDGIPFLLSQVAARARCAGTFELRKNGSGTVRNGMWENEAIEITRQMRRFRVRWICAANPCCRTFRSARRERNGWEPPRHKNANRNSGSAMDAAE